MSKRIEFRKIAIFMGITDHWGFGIDYTPREKSFVVDFVHWYIGIEPAWGWEGGDW